MQCPDIPASEDARLKALDALNIVDTPAEPDFDGVTALLAMMLEVPIALISLVDRDRQWFKSRHGLAATQTPRDVSFCGHVVANDQVLVVRDALADERFHDNPLVVGEPVVRFYAGMPLRSPEGFVLGTLCAIDHVPRELTASQLSLLQTLAHQVTVLLELRRRNLELEALQQQLQGSLREKVGLVAQLEDWTSTLEARVRERTLDLERSHDSLNESERKYRTLYDNLADMCATLDVETERVVDCNATLSQALGYTKHELVGRSVRDLYAPQSHAAHDEDHGLFGQAKELRDRERILLCKDGSGIEASLSATVLEATDGRALALAVWRNIATRKQAERDRQFLAALTDLQRFSDSTALVDAALSAIVAYFAVDRAYQVKDYTSIPFDEYARGLATSILDVAGVSSAKIRLEFEIEPLMLDVERAIPCGLVLNELVHNSLKHAFPAEREGYVRIQLFTRDGSILMTVADNGVGFASAALDQPKPASLGMQLVQMLVKQLRGELALRSSSGSEIQVRFPALPPST
jgi:PAS domain S-box-containing protein